MHTEGEELMKNVNISRALSSTRPRRRLQRAACAVAQNARSAQAASCQPAGNAAARLIQVPTNPTISTQMINISGSRNPLATACRNIFFLSTALLFIYFNIGNDDDDERGRATLSEE